MAASVSRVVRQGSAVTLGIGLCDLPRGLEEGLHLRKQASPACPRHGCWTAR